MYIYFIFNIAPALLIPFTSNNNRVAAELAARVTGLDEADDFFLLRGIL